MLWDVRPRPSERTHDGVCGMCDVETTVHPSHSVPELYVCGACLQEEMEVCLDSDSD